MTELEVYHDESYRKNKRWLNVGLLWTIPSYKHNVVEDLQHSREKNEYYGKIHYRTLTDHSPKRKTAIEWFQIATAHLKKYLWFYLLAVDRSHPMYESRRFGCHFHEYNRFTSIALFSSFRWFFPRNSPATIVFFSDSKTRRTGGDKTGNGITSDNFEEYLCRRFAFDVSKDQERTELPFSENWHENDRFTEKSSLREVKIVNSRNEHVRERSEEEEIVQLCDLLLGSFGAFLTDLPSTKNKKCKQYMCMGARKLIEDIEKEPWKQQYGLHRRLWVGGFPNHQGKIYQGRISGRLEKEDSKLDRWLVP